MTSTTDKYSELLEIYDDEDAISRFQPEDFQKEVVVDQKTGVARQAGATAPAEFINRVKKRCESDLHVFSKAIMGRDYLTKALHLPICNFLQKTPPFRKLLLLPRDHAKTSIVAHCLPPHIIIQSAESNIYFPGWNGSEMRILLAGETEGMASRNLRVVQAVWESNQLFRTLWPHVCWTKPKSEAKKWNNLEMIVPRETEWPDPTVRAIGVGGAITGARPTVLIKDDLVSIEAANSETVMQTAIDWHIASRALMEEYEKDTGMEALEFIIGCLPATSQVLMQDGGKRNISDVKVGEFVWAAGKDKSFHPRRVEAVIPQGVAETLTIKTTAHTLRATKNHPFLVSCNGDSLTWRQAQFLRPDDLVVSVKEIPGKLLHPWMDEEFCWLFGFMFGDGWVNSRKRKGYVCFSPGVDEKLNQRVLDAFDVYFAEARFYLTKGGYYRADSCGVAAEFDRLGFLGGAKTKRLPSWVFSLPPEHRRAFLRGFCDADGCYWGRESWNVEISNRALLEDFRHLANLCGVRTGVLDSRTRVLQPPNSPEPIIATSWRSSFNFATVDRAVEMAGSCLDGFRNIGRETKLHQGLRFERIKEVTKNKVMEPVYDLTVEGTHSFFANSLAVHNTRWAVWDLYEYVIQNDPTVETVIRAIVEDEKPIWPERFDQPRIAQLQREFGSMFWLLYMNSAANPELSDFDVSKVRYFEFQGNELLFTETEDDAILEEKWTRNPLGDGVKTPSGAPLNKHTWKHILGRGRGEFFRLRYG